MLLDLVYGAVILLAGGWIFVWIVAGTFTTMRDAKRKAYQSQFCPSCGVMYKEHAYLEDYRSRTHPRPMIHKRYCPNGHSWVVGVSSGLTGESPIDRLGGWAP